MSRTLAEFLGPFASFPNYPEDQPVPQLEQNDTTPISKPEFIVIDFDIRPQYCLLDRSTRRRYTSPIDWESIQKRVVSNVGRIISKLVGCTVPRWIEGACSDGTVTCVALLKVPQPAEAIGALFSGLTERLKNAAWLDGHGAVVVPVNVPPRPRLDQISITVMDPANKKMVPMVAENFWATTDKNKSFPLEQWGLLVKQLESRSVTVLHN